MVGWADQTAEGVKGSGSDVGMWRLRLGSVLVACGNIMRGWQFMRCCGWPLTLVSTQYSLSQSLHSNHSLCVSDSLSLSTFSHIFFYFLFFIILFESASRVKSVNGLKKKFGLGLGGPVRVGLGGGGRKGWLGLKYYI